MMSENIARNMLSSQGIINYLTQLHLVGHFRILYHDERKHEYQTHSINSKRQVLPCATVAFSERTDCSVVLLCIYTVYMFTVFCAWYTGYVFIIL
jgi:hypothetical protein